MMVSPRKVVLAKVTLWLFLACFLPELATQEAAKNLKYCNTTPFARDLVLHKAAATRFKIEELLVDEIRVRADELSESEDDEVRAREDDPDAPEVPISPRPAGQKKECFRTLLRASQIFTRVLNTAAGQTLSEADSLRVKDSSVNVSVLRENLQECRTSWGESKTQIKKAGFDENDKFLCRLEMQKYQEFGESSNRYKEAKDSVVLYSDDDWPLEILNGYTELTKMFSTTSPLKVAIEAVVSGKLSFYAPHFGGQIIDSHLKKLKASMLDFVGILTPCLEPIEAFMAFAMDSESHQCFDKKVQQLIAEGARILKVPGRGHFNLERVYERRKSVVDLMDKALSDLENVIDSINGLETWDELLSNKENTSSLDSFFQKMRTVGAALGLIQDCTCLKHCNHPPAHCVRLVQAAKPNKSMTETCRDRRGYIVPKGHCDDLSLLDCVTQPGCLIQDMKCVHFLTNIQLKRTNIGRGWKIYRSLKAALAVGSDFHRHLVRVVREHQRQVTYKVAYRPRTEKYVTETLLRYFGIDTFLEGFKDDLYSLKGYHKHGYWLDMAIKHIEKAISMLDSSETPEDFSLNKEPMSSYVSALKSFGESIFLEPQES